MKGKIKSGLLLSLLSIVLIEQGNASVDVFRGKTREEYNANVRGMTDKEYFAHLKGRGIQINPGPLCGGKKAVVEREEAPKEDTHKIVVENQRIADKGCNGILHHLKECIKKIFIHTPKKLITKTTNFIREKLKILERKAS